MKRQLFALALLTLSTSLLAAPIKSCRTQLILDKAIPFSVEMTENDKGVVVARIVEVIDGRTHILKDIVTISEHDVRSGLNQFTIQSDAVDSLNTGERYIAHAMTLSMDAEIGATQNPGLDLQKVHHVKIYELEGDRGDMAKIAVVEAKDEQGKDLGSFLGGWLIGACER